MFRSRIQSCFIDVRDCVSPSALLIFVSRRNEWWAVLLFVNNYINDLQCMPQTWLVAVIFQLYMLTPLLLFACVNFQVSM